MLSAALNPASIAIIGASDNPNKIGGRPLLYMSRFGYAGRVYPINPQREAVQGVRAYPDIASLPEAPDLVVIATPASAVRTAVESCAERGVRAVVIMASGYGETTDLQAIAEEAELVSRARAAGMRIIGPNSQGIANFGNGAIASFSTMFLEFEPADGPVAIVSQSGMMSAAPYALLRSRGIGVRYSHATGNDADVSLAEMALAVLHDPEVRLLLLYVEGIRDAAMLARAAALARERDVPIVAVRTGRTARGQAAARSHTGALAQEDRVVDAFFARHGIWRARDVHELVGAAGMYLKGWRPGGRRMAAVSNSGASCVMAADVAEEVGLQLAELGEGTVRALTTQLPSFATATNPVDITAALLTDSHLLGRILATLAADPSVDMLYVAIPVAGAGYDLPAFARAAAEFMARTGKPIAVATPLESVAAHFRAAGVPTFASETDALSRLAQLAAHATLLRQQPPAAPARLDVRLPEGTAAFLDEADSLALLQAHGLPVVPHRRCASAADVRAAFEAFGGRIVVKACASAFPHKSDHGLVVLDVCTAADADRAFTMLTSRLAALGVDGFVLAAPLVTGAAEMMLGARIDPVFGPVVLVGEGGRLVEVRNDTALLVAPVSREEARRALASLRIAPLLTGARGSPPLDIDALCAATARLSDVIVSAADQIASIDMNPVMVMPEGGGALIVDALVERRRPDPSGTATSAQADGVTAAAEAHS